MLCWTERSGGREKARIESRPPRTEGVFDLIRSSSQCALVASVSPESMREVAALAALPRPAGSWVEIRLDRFLQAPDLPAIRAAFPGTTLLATVRSEAEGGGFSGSDEELKGLLTAALSSGFDLIDVEFHRLSSWPGAARREKVVLSAHDPSGMPANPESLLSAMLEKGARVAKLVATPADSGAACDLLDLQLRFADRSVTVFGMGEAGLFTRALSPYLGGRLAYGALLPGKGTAPGQIAALDLAETFGVGTNRRIEGLCALFGGMVSHSFSPALHNGIFAKADRPLLYVPVAMKSLVSEFEPLLGRLDSLGLPLLGASVTIPFKRDVRSVAVYHTEGPANTLLRVDEGFVSANTDREAMLQLIPRAASDGVALILGGGGTAEIAASALGALGYQVHLFTRSPEKAEAWAAEMGICVITGAGMGGIRYDVIVNATPLGLKESDPLPCPESLLSPGVLVFDSPYHPAGTRLTRLARERGATVIPGLRFLLEQAVLQSRKFTGLPVTSREMLDALPARQRSLFEALP